MKRCALVLVRFAAHRPCCRSNTVPNPKSIKKRLNCITSWTTVPDMLAKVSAADTELAKRHRGLSSRHH